MVSVLRPGQRILNIPGIGVQTSRRAVASAAWWLAGGAPTPVAVWQPIRAASLAASYLRIAGNAGYANIDPAVVGGVAPSFDAATGWGTNTTQYLKTGIVPEKQTWAVLARYSERGNIGFVAGAATSGTFLPTFGLRPAYNVSDGAAYSGSSLTFTMLSSGVLALAGTTVYKNGVAVAGSIANYAGTITTDIYIGAINNGGSVGFAYLGNIQAVAIWDTSTNHATWMPAVMAAAAAL